MLLSVAFHYYSLEITLFEELLHSFGNVSGSDAFDCLPVLGVVVNTGLDVFLEHCAEVAVVPLVLDIVLEKIFLHL